MQIIDNFLPDDEFISLSNCFPGEIKWSYQDTIVTFDKNDTFAEDNKDCYQFVHTFFSARGPLVSNRRSESCYVLNELLKRLNPYYLLRIKANIRPKSSRIIHSQFHVDLGKNTGQKTAIYYLNTNDGYTLFEEGSTRVDSIANRLVIFDGSERHCGTSCTDQKLRMVLNINYLAG